MKRHSRRVRLGNWLGRIEWLFWSRAVYSDWLARRICSVLDSPYCARVRECAQCLRHRTGTSYVDTPSGHLGDPDVHDGYYFCADCRVNHRDNRWWFLEDEGTPT